MSEGDSLGKARLDLTANLDEFVADMKVGKAEAGSMGDALDSLAAVAKISEEALNRVKLGASQAAESDVTASAILEGVRGVSDEARTAARELDNVKLGSEQAAETRLNADAEVESLKKVERQAIVTREAVKSSSGRSVGGTSVGLLAGAIGGAALITPAAGPAVAGLLASLPVLATTGAGALGTLALAFDGVTKAIGGDKKAFDDLGPAAQQFTLTVRSLDGLFDKLRNTAASNLFPGLTEALHSALSPGTIGAVTTAIGEFARAIGQAGAAWGKYFGSAEFQQIFGSLMQAGAQNLKTISSAALSLFDAIGVLGRAAIPFTTWLVTSAAAGTRWVDTFLHARDASGQLTGAMREAQTSLQLVAGLVASLVRAIGALGGALYPVSKVAVKDLTDGLNALAGIIDRNKQTIRDIVGGALAALVQTIKVLVPIAGTLVGLLKSVVDKVGGWKVAFEIVIGGLLAAKFVSLASTVGGFVSKLTEARLGMLSLGAPEVLAALAAAAGAWILLTGNKSDSFNGAFPAGSTDVSAITGQRLKVAQQVQSLQQQGKTAAQIQRSLAPKIDQYQLAQAFADAKILSTGGGTSSAYFSQQDVLGLLLRNGVPANVAQNIAKISAKGEDPSGDPTRINNNPSTGDYSVGLFQENFFNKLGPARVKQFAPQFGLSPNMSVEAFTKWLGQHPDAQAKIAYKIYQSQGYGAWTTAAGLGIGGGGKSSVFGADPAFTKNTGQPTAAQQLAQSLQAPVTKDQTLAAHFKALAAAANTGPMIAKYLDDEASALAKENAALTKSMQGKNVQQKAQIQKTIQGNVDEIAKLHRQMVQAISLGKDEASFKAFQATIATLATRFKADSAYATVLSGDAANAYRVVLEGDLDSQASMLTTEVAKLKTKLATASGKTKTKLQTELTKVQGQLSNVQGQILSTLDATVQDLQSKVGTAFSRVQSEMDAQFEAATQKLIEAAGAQFFQNGLQTPLEAQLASMQAQDQMKQLQDAVAQATDPASKAAAQRQLDEYDLGIRAAKERIDADKAYAAAVKQIQTERTALEAAMNKQLATLADGFANGTASIADLNAVATEYGVTLDQTTIPDLADLSTATDGLKAAFKNLADYIAKITGTAPTIPDNSSATSTVPSLAGAIRIARPGRPVALASGGIVLPRPGGTFARLAEAGVPEAVIPLTKGFAVRAGGDIVLEVDGRELARAAADGLSNNRHAVRIVAKSVKPALDRVVSIPNR